MLQSLAAIHVHACLLNEGSEGTTPLGLVMSRKPIPRVAAGAATLG